MNNSFVSFSSFVIYDTPLAVRSGNGGKWFLVYAYLIPTDSSKTTVTLQKKISGGFEDVLCFEESSKPSIGLMYEVNNEIFKIEGNQPMRLVFASKNKDELMVRYSLPDNKTTLQKETKKMDCEMIAQEMRRLVNVENPLHNLFELFNELFPENLFQKRNIGINPQIKTLLSLFFRRIEKEQLLDEYVKLIHYVDTKISLENRISQGAGMFITYFLDVFSNLVDYIYPILMNQRNYVYFLGVMSIFRKKEFVKSMIREKQPMLHYIPYEPLSSFVSYLIVMSNEKIEFHKGILNLISLVARVDEMKLVFNSNNIMKSFKKKKTKLSQTNINNESNAHIIEKYDNKKFKVCCLDEKSTVKFNEDEKIENTGFTYISTEVISLSRTKPLELSIFKGKEPFSLAPKKKNLLPLCVLVTIFILSLITFISLIMFK